MNDLILSTYLSKFQKLNRGITQYGKAPHKPILLLSIIDEIENGNIKENKIFITPDFVATFKENFSLLVNTPHKSDFIQPFYYLQSEGFWHIKTKDNEPIKSFIRSFSLLNDKVDYGFFDEELFLLFSNSETINILKINLLDTYFSETKNQYLKNKGSGYIQDLEQYVLNEKTENYGLKLNFDDEEEQFVRGGLFKKLVPQVYNSTCCISGMKVISNYGFSMIDACHIVPFHISKNDTITNGIALCPNLHRAFDRGLISIDRNYKVVISKHFAEDETNTYSLRKLEGKAILLPFGEIHYPKKEYFEWHLSTVFKR